jgi:hypothetical protein
MDVLMDGGQAGGQDDEDEDLARLDEDLARLDEADELEVVHPEEFVPADCVRRTRLKEAIAEHKRTATDVKFEEVVVHEAAMNMPI